MGTSWWSDPTEEVVAILMSQSAWTSPAPPNLQVDFPTCVYQAIDD
jgi:hypothetical protein